MLAIQEVVNEVYDLFIDLDATEDQLEFPVLYTVARRGTVRMEPDGEDSDLRLLFQAILDRLPAPSGEKTAPLQLMVSNLDYSEYLGRMAIGRLSQGVLKSGSEVAIAKNDDVLETTRITKLFTFVGLERVPCEEAPPGDIVCLAGVEGISIGDTITDAERPAPLPRLSIDEPTLSMVFSVNSAPFAGRDGEFVTSRKIRERLDTELLTNVSLQLEETDSADGFTIHGRGELQLAVLVETMRREGYELSLSNPEVITKEVNGVKKEPFEMFWVDVAEPYQGVVVEKLGIRKGQLVHMINHGSSRVRLQFRIPSRGLIGIRSELLADTRGTAVMNTMFDGYDDLAGQRAQTPERGVGGGPKGPRYSLRLTQSRGPRRALHWSGNRSLRGDDGWRERQAGRSRRQRDEGKEADQYPRIHRRYRRTAYSPPTAQSGAGHRVHPRRRVGGSDAEVDSIAKENLRRQPTTQATRGLDLTQETPTSLARDRGLLASCRWRGVPRSNITRGPRHSDSFVAGYSPTRPPPPRKLQKTYSQDHLLSERIPNRRAPPVRLLGRPSPIGTATPEQEFAAAWVHISTFMQLGDCVKHGTTIELGGESPATFGISQGEFPSPLSGRSHNSGMRR